MFGIDSIIASIQSLFERVKQFFTLTKQKGVGGAIETMATNTFNEFKSKAEATLNEIPQTFQKGSSLVQDIASFASGKKFDTASTTGPDGAAPPSSPAAPPAANPSKAPGV